MFQPNKHWGGASLTGAGPAEKSKMTRESQVRRNGQRKVEVGGAAQAEAEQE